MDQYFSTNLKKVCQNIEDKSLKDYLLQKISSMNLSEKEEDILIKIFPVVVDNLDTYLDFISIRLGDMRGLNNVSNAYFHENEIKELNFSDQNFDWEKFVRNLLRSIVLWDEEGYEYYAMRMLDKFDEATNGTFLFEDFPEAYSSICVRASLILMFRHFSIIREEYMMHILHSELLPLAIAMGFDLDKSIQSAIEYYDILSSRLELNRKIAVFLMLNKSVLGKNAEGDDVDLSYWINQFELFSNKKFDGISLVNFFNDQERWKNTDEIDKMTVKNLIVVFTFLVDGHYILPAKSDAIEMKKNTEISTSNKSYKADEIKNRFVGIIDPTEIITKLQELSEKYKDPKILELYYYDETAGDFKWKE